MFNLGVGVIDSFIHCSSEHFPYFGEGFPFTHLEVRDKNAGTQFSYEPGEAHFGPSGANLLGTGHNTTQVRTREEEGREDVDGGAK